MERSERATINNMVAHSATHSEKKRYWAYVAPKVATSIVKGLHNFESLTRDKLRRLQVELPKKYHAAQEKYDRAVESGKFHPDCDYLTTLHGITEECELEMCAIWRTQSVMLAWLAQKDMEATGVRPYPPEMVTRVVEIYTDLNGHLHKPIHVWMTQFKAAYRQPNRVLQWGFMNIHDGPGEEWKKWQLDLHTLHFENRLLLSLDETIAMTEQRLGRFLSQLLNEYVNYSLTNIMGGMAVSFVCEAQMDLIELSFRRRLYQRASQIGFPGSEIPKFNEASLLKWLDNYTKSKKTSVASAERIQKNWLTSFLILKHYDAVCYGYMWHLLSFIATMEAGTFVICYFWDRRPFAAYRKPPWFEPKIMDDTKLFLQSLRLYVKHYEKQTKLEIQHQNLVEALAAQASAADLLDAAMPSPENLTFSETSSEIEMKINQSNILSPEEQAFIPNAKSPAELNLATSTLDDYRALFNACQKMPEDTSIPLALERKSQTQETALTQKSISKAEGTMELVGLSYQVVPGSKGSSSIGTGCIKFNIPKGSLFEEKPASGDSSTHSQDGAGDKKRKQGTPGSAEADLHLSPTTATEELCRTYTSKTVRNKEKYLAAMGNAVQDTASSTQPDNTMDEKSSTKGSAPSPGPQQRSAWKSQGSKPKKVKRQPFQYAALSADDTTASSPQKDLNNQNISPSSSKPEKTMAPSHHLRKLQQSKRRHQTTPAQSILSAPQAPAQQAPTTASSSKPWITEIVVPKMDDSAVGASQIGTPHAQTVDDRVDTMVAQSPVIEDKSVPVNSTKPAIPGIAPPSPLPIIISIKGKEKALETVKEDPIPSRAKSECQITPVSELVKCGVEMERPEKRPKSVTFHKVLQNMATNKIGRHGGLASPVPAWNSNTDQDTGLESITRLPPPIKQGKNMFVEEASSPGTVTLQTLNLEQERLGNVEEFPALPSRSKIETGEDKIPATEYLEQPRLLSSTGGPLKDSISTRIVAQAIPVGNTEVCKSNASLQPSGSHQSACGAKGITVWEGLADNNLKTKVAVSTVWNTTCEGFDELGYVLHTPPLKKEKSSERKEQASQPLATDEIDICNSRPAPTFKSPNQPVAPAQIKREQSVPKVDSDYEVVSKFFQFLAQTPQPEYSIGKSLKEQGQKMLDLSNQSRSTEIPDMFLRSKGISNENHPSRVVPEKIPEIVQQSKVDLRRNSETSELLEHRINQSLARAQHYSLQNVENSRPEINPFSQGRNQRGWQGEVPPISSGVWISPDDPRRGQLKSLPVHPGRFQNKLNQAVAPENQYFDANQGRQLWKSENRKEESPIQDTVHLPNASNPYKLSDDPTLVEDQGRQKNRSAYPRQDPLAAQGPILPRAIATIHGSPHRKEQLTPEHRNQQLHAGGLYPDFDLQEWLSRHSKGASASIYGQDQAKQRCADPASSRQKDYPIKYLHLLDGINTSAFDNVPLMKGNGIQHSQFQTSPNLAPGYHDATSSLIGTNSKVALGNNGGPSSLISTNPKLAPGYHDHTSSVIGAIPKTAFGYPASTSSIPGTNPNSAHGYNVGTSSFTISNPKTALGNNDGTSTLTGTNSNPTQGYYNGTSSLMGYENQIESTSHSSPHNDPLKESLIPRRYVTGRAAREHEHLFAGGTGRPNNYADNTTTGSSPSYGNMGVIDPPGLTRNNTRANYEGSRAFWDPKHLFLNGFLPPRPKPDDNPAPSTNIGRRLEKPGRR